MEWHIFNRAEKDTWPPKEGRYLVTIDLPDYEICRYVDCRLWCSVHGTGIDYIRWAGDYGNYIVAWAFLPYPYDDILPVNDY